MQLERAYQHYELERGLVRQVADKPDRDVRADEKRWMKDIGDNELVCDLTIPGTHDSAAYTYAVPFIATQTLDIAGQLDAGIRYLDLRCGLRNDVLEMVHGVQTLGISLDEVLSTVYNWLDEHPSEGLIVQLKKDRDDETATISFMQAVVALLDRRAEYWRTANTTPKMGELRGRVQLLRRFRGDGLSAYGINVSRWQDNPRSPFTMDVGHGISVTVQDHYRYDELESFPSVVEHKCKEVLEVLRLAGVDMRADHWYINFTSALEFNWRYQYPPRKIAEGGWYGIRRVTGVNIRTLEYFRSQHGEARFGIVAMDFPNLTIDLIATIVSTNFRPSHLSRLKGIKPSSGRPLLLLVLILSLSMLYIASQHLNACMIWIRYSVDRHNDE